MSWFQNSCVVFLQTTLFQNIRARKERSANSARGTRGPFTLECGSVEKIITGEELSHEKPGLLSSHPSLNVALLVPQMRLKKFEVWMRWYKRQHKRAGFCY